MSFQRGRGRGMMGGLVRIVQRGKSKRAYRGSVFCAFASRRFVVVVEGSRDDVGAVDMVRT